jgi:hypothetical protein
MTTFGDGLARRSVGRVRQDVCAAYVMGFQTASLPPTFFGLPLLPTASE